MDRLRELWERAHPHTDAIVVMQSKKLIGKAGLTRSDVPEIRQDMLMAVWRALPRFDPKRGPLEAFINSVVINAGRMLVRSRRRKKRGGGPVPVSLDAEPGLAAKARKILDGPCEGAAASSVLDARAAVASLPPHLGSVAVMLAGKSVMRTAELTGRTAREVREARDLIREHFRRLGLAEEI